PSVARSGTGLPVPGIADGPPPPTGVRYYPFFGFGGGGGLSVPPGRERRGRHGGQRARPPGTRRGDQDVRLRRDPHGDTEQRSGRRAAERGARDPVSHPCSSLSFASSASVRKATRLSSESKR